MNRGVFLLGFFGKKEAVVSERVNFDMTASLTYMKSEIQFFEVASQCVLPGWEGRKAVFEKFALVEAAVEGTGGFGSAVLGGGDGVYGET